MFGMIFDNNRWVNMDNKPTDYFRWWSLENKNSRFELNLKNPPKRLEYDLYINPTKGHKHVYLMTRTNGPKSEVPTFGYWGNVFEENDKIPFFLCQIKQAKSLQ